MSGAVQVNDEVYFFVIANGKDGYAEFTKVFKRPDSAEREKALSEILEGVAPLGWIDVTGSCAAGGLDMRFSSSCDRLIFILIVNDERSTEAGPLHLSHTYFGDEVVLDLGLCGKPTIPVVSDCQRHGPDAKYPEMCSFKLKMKHAQDEMQGRPDADPISRFPIMFDFVDTSDGVSPVYKRPLKNIAGLVGDVAQGSNLGHGGIHPRGGSSIVEIF